MNIITKFKHWRAAEKKAAFSFRNIVRMLIALFRRDFPATPKHIREQAIWRKTQANITCIEKGVCICGCEFEGLIYANDSCEGNCYPPMKNKREWENFKKIKNITI